MEPKKNNPNINDLYAQKEEIKKEIRISPNAKTMSEATAKLKNLDAKKKKSKSGLFAKGTHGSGAAKMRAEYKKRRQTKSSKKK
jgi:hypothetical protein